MPRTSLVVIGGSGSGKSVLLKCILGLIVPEAGTIEIDGQNVLGLSRREQDAVRSRIGMLFQNGALFDSLPVWQNVSFGLLAQHKSIADGHARPPTVSGAGRARPSVGDLSPAELSGGMQKRVALARAIAAQPDIMFFDEPTTGLDPIMGAVIDDLIVDCVKRLGSTAIAITHDIASARRIGDRAAMLHRAHRLDRTGRFPAEQRQPARGPVHARRAQRSDPDGAAAIGTGFAGRLRPSPSWPAWRRRARTSAPARPPMKQPGCSCRAASVRRRPGGAAAMDRAHNLPALPAADSRRSCMGSRNRLDATSPPAIRADRGRGWIVLRGGATRRSGGAGRLGPTRCPGARRLGPGGWRA